MVLDHLQATDPRFYTLWAAVVMHDHVHLLLHPQPHIALSRIMKGIKGVTSRRINEQRKTRGTLWLNESYDRLVRDQDEFQATITYMYNNPYRAGLINTCDSYPFWYQKTSATED